MRLIIINNEPPTKIEWWPADISVDNYTARCHELYLRTMEIRALIHPILKTGQRTAENVSLMHQLLQKCKDIDQEFVLWSECVPNDHHRQVIAWETNVTNLNYAKAEVFPGRVDRYPNVITAALWNMARCSRILLDCILIRGAAWVSWPADYRTLPEYAASSETCKEAVSDVIASVPWLLGWSPKNRDIAEGPRYATFVCGKEQAQKGLSGYFLTWPLTCLLVSDFLTDNQRLWVHGRLGYIGTELGVKHAVLMTRVRNFTLSVLGSCKNWILISQLFR